MELHDEAAGAPAFSYGNHLYVRAPRGIHFPSEERPEEHVSETKRHLHARTTLYLLLEEALAHAGAVVGSDQFVYWDAGDPKKCLSPDVFVKLGSKDRDFDSWKTWKRGGPPDLAVEIVSDWDRGDAEWESKLERYQASGIAEVVRFDAEDVKAPLRVWDSVDGELIERAPSSATLHECATLGLWWVVVPSDLGDVLRLARDRDGRDLLPTPSEERLHLAEELAAERKARTVAEHERMLADHAREVAERERIAADEARQIAERERIAADQARSLAEQKLLAEQKTREQAERERDSAGAEVERLRAELARLRGQR